MERSHPNIGCFPIERNKTLNPMQVPSMKDKPSDFSHKTTSSKTGFGHYQLHLVAQQHPSVGRTKTSLSP